MITLVVHPPKKGPDGKPGYWNDVRDGYPKAGAPWKDIDLVQVGQAVGAMNEVKPAAEIVKELLAGLITTMQKMGQIGAQAPKL